MKETHDKWCRTTYRQTKIRSDSWSREAAAEAPLAVMSVQLLEAGHVARSQDRRKGLAVRLSATCLCHGEWSFKGWGTDYTQCRYQGLTDTDFSNLINDLCKMVPDAQNNTTKNEQGKWSTKIMVSLCFSNEANLPT